MTNIKLTKNDSIGFYGNELNDINELKGYELVISDLLIDMITIEHIETGVLITSDWININNETFDHNETERLLNYILSK